MRILLLTVLLLVIGAPAYAACATSGMGPQAEGKAFFNADEGVLEYCDDTNWVPMGPPPRYVGTGLPYDSSLVGWWKLDETAASTAVADSSGNGGSGTMTSMTGAANTAAGRIGTALDFDGAADYITIPNTSVLDHTEFTIGLWAKFDTLSGTSTPFETGAGGGFLYLSNNNLMFCGFIDGGTQYEVSASVNIPTANWVHLACSYDSATKDVDFYLNGSSVGTQNIGAHNITPNNDPVHIGDCQYYAGGCSVDGLLDDVRLYNRVLTAAEIADCCASPNFVTNGLIGHWKLDETTGTTAIDSTGSNDGTMQNGLDAATDSVSGKVGTALDFDGGDDYVDIGNSSDLDLYDELTISAWINPDDMGEDEGGEDVGTIFSRYIGDSSGYIFHIWGDNATYNGISLWSESELDDVTADNVLTPGIWQHVLVTKTSADDVIIYVNGVAVGSGTLDLASEPGASAAIGTWSAWPGAAVFDGNIDDVRVYNRVLSADEIAQLARASNGKVVYDADARVPKFFNGDDWSPMGAVKYTPNATHFDDTNDFLHLNSDLSGTSDCNQMTGSLWFYRDDPTGTESPIYDTAGFGTYISFTTGGGGNDPFIVRGRDGGSTYVDLRSTTTFPDQDTAWHHVMWSYDLDDPAKRHLYVDGVDDINVVTFNTGNALDLTYSEHFIGQNDAGSAKYGGDLADVWLDFCTYMDLSDPNNRAKFYDNGPVYLGETGEKVNGTSPEIFLSGDTTDWHTNKGTGGGFTENGAISESSNRPGTVDITSGLVGYWPLDEDTGTTVKNQVAGMPDATMQNGMSVANSVQGKISNAFEWDDTNNIMQADDTAGNYNFTGDFTLSAWIKPDDMGNLKGGCLQGSIVSRDIGWYGLTINDCDGQSGRLSLWSETANARVYSYDDSVAAGVWQHVAVTHNNTGDIITFYVNGEEVGTDVLNFGASGFGSNDLTMGSHNGTSNFDGIIDEVRIYNRVLSASEMKALYRITGACTSPDRAGGEIVYNADNNVMQYCDGENWRSIGK